MTGMRALAFGLVGVIAMLLGVAARAQGIDDGTEDQLRRLKKLCDDGLLSQEVCTEKQRDILGLRVPPGRPAPPGVSPLGLPPAAAPPSLAMHPPAGATAESRSAPHPPQEFSVRLPPGWTQVTPEEIQASREALQKQLAGNPRAQDLLKLVETSTSWEVGRHFRDNGDTLHVSRSPSALVLTPENAEKVCRTLSDRLATAPRADGGRSPALHDCGFRHMAGLPVLYLEQAGIRDGTSVIQLWVGKAPEVTLQFILRCHAAHLAARRNELEAIVAGIQWQ